MRIGAFAAGFAAVGLALAGPAPAEEAEAVEVVSYSAYIQAHPYEQSVISQAGALAVANIGEARQALSDRQYGRARRDVGRARKALQLVKHASPSLRLDDQIGTLHQKVVSGQGGDPKDLVPIYTDLEAYAQVTKATDVRVEIDKAKGHMAGGEVKEAAVSLERARAAIVYVEIDVPVKETLVKLDRAALQLRRMPPDYLAADATLREAQGHLMNFAEIASIEVDTEIVAVGEGPE